MPCRINGPLLLLKAVVSTLLEAHDTRYIQRKNFDRTIAIPTLGVKTTDFGIRRNQVDTLRQAGSAAAETFFKTWDFPGVDPAAPAARGPEPESRQRERPR